jgi:hypothetical protein
MKKLSPIAKYLVEYAQGNTPRPSGKEGMTTVDSGIFSFGDQAVFANVVVKNPKGEAFAAEKKPTFGLGFDMAPTLAASVMDVVRAHGDDKDKTDLGILPGEEGPEWDTDDPSNEYDKFASWQQINRAVGNYLTNRANIAMNPFKLGKVPKNPVGRYDGLDTTKMGLISDKRGRKAKLK